MRRARAGCPRLGSVRQVSEGLLAPLHQGDVVGDVSATGVHRRQREVGGAEVAPVAGIAGPSLLVATGQAQTWLDRERGRVASLLGKLVAYRCKVHRDD